MYYVNIQANGSAYLLQFSVCVGQALASRYVGQWGIVCGLPYLVLRVTLDCVTLGKKDDY